MLFFPFFLLFSWAGSPARLCNLASWIRFLLLLLFATSAAAAIYTYRVTEKRDQLRVPPPPSSSSSSSSSLMDRHPTLVDFYVYCTSTHTRRQTKGRRRDTIESFEFLPCIFSLFRLVGHTQVRYGTVRLGLDQWCNITTASSSSSSYIYYYHHHYY